MPHLAHPPLRRLRWRVGAASDHVCIKMCIKMGPAAHAAHMCACGLLRGVQLLQERIYCEGGCVETVQVRLQNNPKECGSHSMRHKNVRAALSCDLVHSPAEQWCLSASCPHARCSGATLLACGSAALGEISGGAPSAFSLPIQAQSSMMHAETHADLELDHVPAVSCLSASTS